MCQDNINPPLFVDFNVEVDDEFERVTQFERKKIPMSAAMVKQRKALEKLAEQSKGSFNVEKVI